MHAAAPIAYKEIAYASPDYEAELLLRDEVLRKPLGMSVRNDDLSMEHRDFHLGAFSGTALIGVLILTNLGGGTAKMRQVAVEPSQQGSGIGSGLVRYSEQFAHNHGFTLITLHARKTAVRFYLSLEYNIVGDEFIEVGIPHLAMEKNFRKSD